MFKLEIKDEKKLKNKEGKVTACITFLFIITNYHQLGGLKQYTCPFGVLRSQV